MMYIRKGGFPIEAVIHRRPGAVKVKVNKLINNSLIHNFMLAPRDPRLYNMVDIWNRRNMMRP